MGVLAGGLDGFVLRPGELAGQRVFQVLNLLLIDRAELFIRAACELFLANDGALDCVAVALDRNLAVAVAGDRGATAALVRVLGRIALPVSPAITAATRAAAIAITAASSTVSVSPAGAAIAAARSAITATGGSVTGG
ncbi:hypothetical protein [Pseudomonas aeruginosa]|uniref:hypothetical protein n=1 Tax=Pseudomonas aeruginosa TaxID=287 RepID=UPI0013EDA3BD|nr:hypothetical protein [Pseudomonas aeruginosa]